MNPYDNLPDELLIEVCEKMDLMSLTNMVKTSSRINNVCNEILLNKRRKFILSYILTNLSDDEFDRGLEDENSEVLGFTNYDEFVEFQEKQIEDLDTEGLLDIELLINQKIPNLKVMDKEFMTDKDVSGFCFESSGKMVFFSER